MAKLFSDVKAARTASLRQGMTLGTMVALIFGVLVLVAMWPSAAHAWWNDDWPLRKKITIDTSASAGAISDAIGAAPLLVRLHVGNFRFGAAKEDGSDLRFIAGDDKTPLKYHLEKFDSLLGEALAWVAVPKLASGGKTDVWLYFGNKKAVATADAKGTYDPDTVLIYHFSERGTPALDSSVWANNAQSIGQPADGALIGNGLRLDGGNPLRLPGSPSLNWPAATPLTWSAWIKAAAAQPNAVIFSRRDADSGFVIGLDNGVPFVEVSVAGSAQRVVGAAALAASSWHQIAVVATGDRVSLFVDGARTAAIDGAIPALNSAAAIGGEAGSLASPFADGGPSSGNTEAHGAAATAPGTADTAAVAAPAAGFAGDIDEVEISKVARPDGFIRFVAMSEGPDPSKLVVFSVDEETGNWLSGYFGVILKSVTLDGWVVIGILLVMAALSWVVMYDRLSYLNRQSRANDRFMALFRGSSAVAETSDALMLRALSSEDSRKLRASSLFRIYRLGIGELEKRLSDRATVLSAASITAIRAALESSYIKETQRLNRLMVVLTIAISGGPFLGLLGTVVGVMITFAAIAASGDVNVNAIAPGIAAALVATVAGLGVAIPALFGYNYLISRIKDLTSDMQVFIDEYVSYIAEYHAGGPISRQAAE